MSEICSKVFLFKQFRENFLMSAILTEMETTNEPITESNEAGNHAEKTELEQATWSVITFEGVAVSNLTYQEARQWLDKLNEQKISGLCIVTDEAAVRMSK